MNRSATCDEKSAVLLLSLVLAVATLTLSWSAQLGIDGVLDRCDDDDWTFSLDWASASDESRKIFVDDCILRRRKRQTSTSLA